MNNSDAYKIPGIHSLSDPLVAISVVLTDYNISFADVCANSRKRDILKYRQVIHTILLRYTSMTSIEIGKRVGGKDHTTVLYSQKQIAITEFLFKKRMIREELYILYKDIECKYLKLISTVKNTP